MNPVHLPMAPKASTRVWAPGLLWLFVASAVGCGDSAADSDGPGSLDDPPLGAGAVDEATSAVHRMAVRGLTLGEALDLLDMDADSDADRDDRIALLECIDGADRDMCDVTGDGTVDAADLLAFDLLVGNTRPKSQQELAKLAASFRQLLDVDSELTLLELSAGDDYDEDGDTDRDDVLLFADALDRIADELIDLDDSGTLDFGDVSALARMEATAAYEGKQVDVDLTGDGKYSHADLEMLADLSLFASTPSYGSLDYDGNGRLDRADFCLTAESAFGEGLASLFAPVGSGRDELAKADARVMFCRTDGRAMHYGIARADLQMLTLVAPVGVFLQPIADIPADYHIPDPDALTDNALYVLGTQQSDRRLERIAIPLPAAGIDDTASTLTLDGPGLEANAVLLLPGASIALGSARLSPIRRGLGASLQSMPGTSSLDLNLHELAVSDGHIAEREAFQKDLEDVTAQVEAMLGGCPCVEPNRIEFMSRLRKMLLCLRSVNNATCSALSTLQAGYNGAFREFMQLNAASSNAWYHYSTAIVNAEIASTTLLVLETLWDGRKGLPAALGSAVGNLASEYGPGLLSSDDMPDNSCFDPNSTPLGDIAGGFAADNAAAPLGNFVQELGSWLTTMAQARGSSVLGAREFAMRFESIARDSLRESGLDLKDVGEALIKTLIKAIPKVYTYYVKMWTFEAEYAAQEAHESYEGFRRQRGSLEHGKEDIASAVDRLSDLKTQLETKLSQEGCPVSLTRDAPCDIDLDAALQAAEEALLASLAEADDCIAMTTGSSSQTWSEAAEELTAEAASLDVRGIATRLRNEFNAGGSEMALAALHEQLSEADQVHYQAQADIGTACAFFYDATTFEEASKIGMAQAIIDDALEAFRQAVADALKAYEACVNAGGGFGACGFDVTNVVANPWAAASQCLGCLPAVVGECCGDGRQQDSEQCDGSAASCDPGATCNAECMCEGGTGTPWNSPTAATDPTGDFIDSISSAMPYRTSGTMDLISFGATPTMRSQSAVDVDFNNSTYECGASTVDMTVVCPGGVADMPAGDVLRVISRFAASLPSGDGANSYIYSVVFESDGQANNDWVFNPPYDFDLFRDTDRWYQLIWNHMTGLWSVTVTQVDGSQAQNPVNGSTARAVIEGDTLTWYISLAELPAGIAAKYRVTSFVHDGAFTANDRGADVSQADPTQALSSFAP